MRLVGESFAGMPFPHVPAAGVDFSHGQSGRAGFQQMARPRKKKNGGFGKVVGEKFIQLVVAAGIPTDSWSFFPFLPRSVRPDVCLFGYGAGALHFFFQKHA